MTTTPTSGAVPVEFLRGVIALCTQRGYSPENIEAWSTDDKWIADLWRQAAQMLAAAPAQPAAQQGVAYAALPTSNYAGRVYEEGFLIGTCPLYTADQLRAFADATYVLRASHGQAPATVQADSVLEDAARYRLVRRGQHWSVIDGIGNDLRAEALDVAVDAAMNKGGSA